MIAIISKKRLEHLESEAKECEAARKQLDRLESENLECRSKYVLLLREMERLEREAEASKKESSPRDSLLEDLSKTELAILKNASPQLISEISMIFASAARHVVEGSLKIRKVEGIAYRDGAFDAMNILKTIIMQFSAKN